MEYNGRMNTKTGKPWSKTLIVAGTIIGTVLIIITLIHILWVVNAFRVVLSEDPATMEILNANQYIYNKYVGWKEIQLFDGYSFMIPDEWAFVRRGIEASLADGDGITARGWMDKAVPADKGEIIHTERMQALLGYRPVKEYREEYWLHHSGQLGEYGKYTFENESGETQACYYLSLCANLDYIDLFFGPVENGADEDLLEIIMAMAHSFRCQGDGSIDNFS